MDHHCPYRLKVSQIKKRSYPVGIFMKEDNFIEVEMQLRAKPCWFQTLCSSKDAYKPAPNHFLKLELHLTKI